MSQMFFFRLSLVLGASAVIAGAFGAHGLEGRVTDDLLLVFETGARYHMYHALALLALSMAAPRIWESPFTRWAAIAWVAGIAVFSGSLYALTLTGLRWLGAITPIGGLALILGWLLLLGAAKKLSAPNSDQG